MTEFNEAQDAEQTELKRLQQVEELEKLLDEQSDEEFGATEFQVASDDKKAVLKEWTAQDFANIYTRFRPHLERHARRFLRNPSQVDEVVQDAFLYLMVTLPELDSELGVLKFLKWKVRLLCLDVIRAGSKAQLSDIDAHGEFTSDNEPVDENIERVEDAAIVRMALSKLQPRHREVLLASMYEEKSTPEIAAQVGLSENATRQLMFRARAALKKALVGEVETHGMTLNQILSVAARKASQDAKKISTGAMAVLLLVAISIGVVPGFIGSNDEVVIAEAPVSPLSPQSVAPSETADEDTGLANPTESGSQASSEQSPADVPTNLVAEPIEIETEEIAQAQPAQSSDSTTGTATAASLASNEFVVNDEPFDPWLVDSIFEASTASNLINFDSNSVGGDYTVTSEAGMWADFSFQTNSANPLSDVRFGFIAAGTNFFAIPTQRDLIVVSQGNGLESYVIQSEIRAIQDASGVSFANTRMEGARISLEVVYDSKTNKVINAGLFVVSAR